MINNKLTIGDLLDQVEELRARNRDLLPVKDVQVLDDCIKALKELQKQSSAEKQEETFKKALEVIVHLLKFFVGTDLF